MVGLTSPWAAQVSLAAVDPAYLEDMFPQIKAIFKPQVVKYSNTNPDIAQADGGAHGEKVDWKVGQPRSRIVGSGGWGGRGLWPWTLT